MPALQVHAQDRIVARTLAALLDVTPADIVHRAFVALFPSLPENARAAISSRLIVEASSGDAVPSTGGAR